MCFLCPNSKRNEFCTAEDEFESLWVEIKNQKSKTIMCGCMYRHPNTDVLTFLKYIESTISKIDSNKYQIFLMGDFNIDLL